MRTGNIFLTLLLGCIVASCGGSDEESGDPFTKTIGSEGGSLDGPLNSKVTVAPGVLKGDTEFSIKLAEEEPENPPFKPVSPFFIFGKEGLKFDKMVTIRVPFDKGQIPVYNQLPDVKIFITGATGSWEELPTTQPGEDDITVSAGTFHFSAAAAGVKTGMEK